MTLSARELESLIVVSLGNVLVLSDPGEKPLRVALGDDNESRILRVYAWNVTHGGATRSPDEFRIQLTGQMPSAIAGEQTLIVGWSEEFEVFAAWDPRAHLGRGSASPSLQIHRDTLIRAFDEGLAAETRGSGDVAVAMSAGLLRAYAVTVDEMHSEDARIVVEDLNAIPTGTPIVPPPMRLRVTQLVQSYYRAGDFAKRVLDAYDRHCAICGIQLNLVEAAHIVPVAWPGSTDETSNGLCLCRNHHKAYDASLISVDADRRIQISQARTEELSSVSSGLGDLLPYRGSPIRYLPADPSARPRADYLAEGQRARKWRN